MKYKAIIYDIDGTLLDTFDMNFYPLTQVIKEELDIDMTYEEALKYVSYPGMKTLQLLGIKNEEIKRVYSKWVEYVNAYPEGAKAYEGIEELLKEMPLRQAIVSSKKRKQYEIDFISKGYDKYIEIAILEEDVKKHKPNPEGILKCIEKLNLNKEDVLYIGDAKSDYDAAKAAGIDFGYALWGIEGQLDIDATYMFNSPLEILNL